MGVKHREAFAGEAFAKFGAGALSYREIGISDDDEARLKLIEQEIADWLGLGWKARDDDVCLQVRVTIQQRVLAGAAKVG